MKREIIAHMRDKAGLSPQQAEDALNAVASAITAVTNRDGQARIPGFGTFKVKTRAARTGRNPATGEIVQVAEKKVLTFKEAKGG